MTRITRKLMIVAVALVATSALLIPSASATTKTQWSYVSPNVWMKSCPNTGCANRALLPAGTGVIMLCWGDYQWALGNYWSPRWFAVWTPYGSGWVHSSYVYNQAAVRHC